MDVCSLPTRREATQIAERVAAEQATVNAQITAASTATQPRFRLTIEYCAHCGSAPTTSIYTQCAYHMPTKVCTC